MAARTLPNLGLLAYWPLGDDTWKDGMDENLFRLSVLGQLVAETFVEGEPAGAEGKVVLTRNAAPIGIYENGAWHYINAKTGWLAYVVSEAALHVWDGNSWEPVTTGGGGGGGSGLPVGGQPGQVLVKTGGGDGVAGWANLTGKSAYQAAVDEGFQGTVAQWLNSLKGAAGASAYQVAVAAGFQGNEAAWLASLHGADSTVPGPPGLGVPPGGTTGQVLAKDSDADNDTSWIDPPEGGGGADYPPGGATGQVLAKASNADNDVEWIAPPEGGSGSAEDQNEGWNDSLPVGEHRYWRMRVPPEGGGAHYFPGFDFLDENLVPFAGQNWMDREGQRAQLQAGDPGGYVGFGNAPYTIATDLGYAKRLGGMSITPRYGPFDVQATYIFYMEGSDDNANWITYALVSNIAHGSGERQFFRIRPYLVRFLNASSGAPSTLMEIAYAAVAGGANLTVPATDPASRGRMRGYSTGGGYVRHAFNGDTAGSGQYMGEAANFFADYAFDFRPTLGAIRVTARATYYGQTPDHFFLQSSRDGINWTTFYESPAGIAWGDNETKSFALPDLVRPGLPDTAGQAGRYLRVNPPGNGAEWAMLPVESIIIAASDETTPLVAGAAKVTFRMPYAFRLTAVRASVTTASSNTAPVIGIKEGGVSILSTKITLDVNEKSSVTAATPPVISDPNLADDAEITIDIENPGTGTAGLKVYLIGRQP